MRAQIKNKNRLAGSFNSVFVIRSHQTRLQSGLSEQIHLRLIESAFFLFPVLIVGEDKHDLAAAHCSAPKNDRQKASSSASMLSFWYRAAVRRPAAIMSE